MTQPDPERQLERYVDRLLRQQPLRQAPPDLSMRVLSALERKAARPWWQGSFAEWPTWARLVFVLASILVGVFAVDIASGVVDAVDSRWSSTWNRGHALWLAARSTFSAMTQVVPGEWLYIGVIVVGALYAAFFAVSAAAYRLLVQNRQVRT